MKALCIVLLVVSSLAFSIEINNIHNGYRNVYKGIATLDQ
jgi:hypothetical protein